MRSGDMRLDDMSVERQGVASPRWRGPLVKRLGIPVAYLSGLAALTALIAGGYLDVIALVVAGSLAVAIAYRFPVLTIAALVALGILLPTFRAVMLQMTQWQGLGNGSFIHVLIEDLVLLPMAGAVAVRIVVLVVDQRRTALPRFLALAIALGSLLAMLFVLGVATGFTVRPLSALREFTVSYLGLVIVPYIALFLRSRRDITRVFKGVALVGVGVPLVMLPLVGQLKGWGIGPQARFYSADVHMGILYGLVAVYLLQARERAGRLVFAVVLPLSAFLIIADGHRSVWLAAGVSLVVLTLTGRIRLERFWKWGFIAALVLALAGTALMALGKDPLGYVASRSVAFSDPSADGNASWRLAIWQSAIQQGRSHLVLGEGFGSYYEFQTSFGTITTSPHNLYVQTFLKLGLFGLLTYMALAAVVAATLASAWRRVRRSGDSQMEPVLLMSVVAVCASLAFSLVYGFEAYSIIFVGLGLAAALRATDRIAAP